MSESPQGTYFQPYWTETSPFKGISEYPLKRIIRLLEHYCIVVFNCQSERCKISNAVFRFVFRFVFGFAFTFRILDNNTTFRFLEPELEMTKYKKDDKTKYKR